MGPLLVPATAAGDAGSLAASSGSAISRRVALAELTGAEVSAVRDAFRGIRVLLGERPHR